MRLPDVPRLRTTMSVLESKRSTVRSIGALMTGVAIVAGPSASASIVDTSYDYGAYTHAVRDDERRWQSAWRAAVADDLLGNRDALATRLVDHRFAPLDATCGTSPLPTDAPLLRSTVADLLIGVTAPAAVGSDAGDRGRGLTCLVRSGLERVVMNVESRVYESYALRDAPMLACRWGGAAAAALPAQTNMSSHSITWRLSGDRPVANTEHRIGWIDHGRMFPPVSSPLTFHNVLLHEFVHVGQVPDEDVAYAAQDCCGDRAGDRAASCATLDALVARDRKVDSLARRLRRANVFVDLHPGVPADGITQLAHRFYVDLGDAMPDLVTVEALDLCIARSGFDACRNRVRRAVDLAVRAMFSKGCDALPQVSRDACANISPATRNTLTPYIVDQLMPVRR